MAFRSTLTSPNLDQEYGRAKTEAARVKNQTDALILRASSGNINYAQDIRPHLDVLMQARDTFTRVASAPGIVDYARAQEADPAYDPVAEFTAMVAALDNVVGWVTGTINGLGKLFTLNADGSEAQTQFTPAQTATYRAQLQALSDTIA